MSKHSTTPRTLSRRLAALLAALALLAAMALPVYAEAQNEDTTKIAETVETVNETETTDDTTASTDSDDPTDTIPADPTDDSTTAADDAATDTNPSNDDADTPNDTPAGENPDADMADATDQSDEATDSQPIEDEETAENDALVSEEDSAQVQTATAGGVTIYFLAPSEFDATGTVKFHARLQSEVENDNWYTGWMTDSGKTDQKGRKIFSIIVYPGKDSCIYGGYAQIEFITYKSDGTSHLNDYWGHGKSGPAWKGIDNFANKIYDPKADTWTACTPFDPNNHQTFAGKTMLFQNQSGRELTNVKAVFYEKTNGILQPVETIYWETIAAGQRVSFKIPKKACSYVQFTAGDAGDERISSLYNFYDQQDEEANEHFLYDSGTACCYVYNGNDGDSSWTIPQGKITVYFDATFSSAYTEGNDNLSIPKKGSSDVYYCLKNDNGETLSKIMDQGKNNLYSVMVPEGYSQIMFSGEPLTSPAKSGISTDWVSIDRSLDEPCYIADTNDAVVYNSGASRGGYWTEKGDVRDAEAGKHTTVVDIDNKTPFVRNSKTKYVNTTLYDYYTDWELNGNNRDNYIVNNGASQRNWVTFRQFDQALSDYYQSYTEKTVQYPIYTGHFQPDCLEVCKFSDIADKDKLNLYGWSNYNTFFSVNNSATNIDGGYNQGGKDDPENYKWTFQGLVSEKLSDDGTPTMYGTDLAEPHFNKAFLEGANSKKAVLGKVYENVDFPFTKKDVFGNGISYWHYESNDQSLFLKQKEGTEDQYFLQQPETTAVENKHVSDKAQNVDSASNPSRTYGFFPFNEGSTKTHANTYNYGFGAKLQFDFTLTDDGNVLDNKGNKVPIQFFFSGDDDVWVYIDNDLALDVGGAHGKASGLLEFGAENGKLIYTSYVSKVKTGNTKQSYQPCNANDTKTIHYLNNSISFNYKDGPKEISAGKHTLKFFYMERGMWESNMAIAFNFPDHNELQVEKKVNVNGVNELFKNYFTNQKLFNFTIQNQATHYGPKSVDEGSFKQEKPIKLSDIGYTLDKPNDSNNCFELADDPDTKNTDNNTGQKVIHWYAKYNDTYSDYRDARMGVITLKSPVSINNMDYLSFYIYAKGEEGEGVLSLSNMYLQLVDNSGKVLGCMDKESLSGTTYNQVDLKNNEWINIKLDLSRLKVHGDFNKTEVAAIRIGDNYQRHIYFKDFTFTANPTVQKITGFTTEQDKIPDYGSAKTGKLKPAENAQFSSSIDRETRAVDENGQFTLQDKEVVTFSDQFRRGSYLSVTEEADAALFDTTWTIYENGVPVETMNSGETVQNANPAAPSVVEQSGCTPDDGRTENVVNQEEQTNNEYNVAAKPAGDKTIVFRSYTNPDAGDAAELTKLKLQFVNKVKTGSLTIQKKAAAGEQELIGKGEYTFTVTFTHVGGLALESQPIEEPVTIQGINSYTISGIPVGTRFHIEETSTNNNANVSSVTVSGGGDDRKVVNGKEAIGSIVEDKQGDSSTVAVATFTNTMRTLIDIDLTKKWVDADNKPLEGENLPNTIYVQLQRKTETQSDSEWKPVEGTDQNYVEVKRDNGGWAHKFTNLDANDYTSTANPRPVYQYRVVEGTLSAAGEFEAKDTLLLSDGHTYTCEDGVMKSTTTADGKTSNTITLTNKRLNPKFTLDVTKKSAENDGENDQQKLLAGVEFTLEKMKDDGNGKLVVDGDFNKLTGLTNAQGVLMLKDSDETQGFKELEAGTYRLTETKAAENYNLLSAPILVTFGKDGTCTLNGSKIEVSTTEKRTEFTKNEDGSYTLALTVLNRKTPALPHTGADAPSLWLLIGLPLAVAGLLILVFRYNKKGGRTR